MSSLVILVPVLGRPERVAPLVASVDESLAHEDGLAYEIVFLATPNDAREITTLERLGCKYELVNTGNHQYPMKINHGATVTYSDWLLMGADDLVFRPGWWREAMNVHIATGAVVIGTQDEGNQLVKRGLHSTHTLVHRSYVGQGTMDNTGVLLHEGYDHNCCNPPEARVWMADLSFKNLGDIEVGDEVMGWHRPARDHLTRDEIDDLLVSELSNRRVGEIVGVSPNHVRDVRSGAISWDERYRPWKMPLKRLCGAQVEAIGIREAPLVRVVMESGREFRCTPDHLWLNGQWSPSTRHGREWINAAVGRTLLHVIDEPRRLNREELRTAGWLGGIYDGEGSGVYAATQSAFRNPEVCEAIGRRLTDLGIAHSIPDGSAPGVRHFSLLGGRQTFLDFLTWCQPVKDARLAAKIKNTARFGTRDKIVAIEPAASGEVISMTTTTGNYVVWGYASRNCDVEFVETAMHRGVWAFADKCVIHHEHPLWTRGLRRDATYRKGFVNARSDRALLNHRRHLWRKKPDPGPVGLNARQQRVVRARAPISSVWPPR